MTFALNPIWRRRLAVAFLTWLVPFVTAVPFYGPDGLLVITAGIVGDEAVSMKAKKIS